MKVNAVLCTYVFMHNISRNNSVANASSAGTVDTSRDVSGLVRHVLRAKFSQKYSSSVSAL